MYEYKVVTEKDSFFRGRFDADAIEETLNAYAADGWRLTTGLGVSNMKTSGGRVMFVLERSGQPAPGER